MKNPGSLIPKSIILNSLSYNKYVNSKSDKESVLLFYFN